MAKMTITISEESLKVRAAEGLSLIGKGFILQRKSWWECKAQILWW